MLRGAALEQSHAQKVLQARDLVADGRWRQVQVVRRQAETHAPRHGVESEQTVERWQAGGQDSPRAMRPWLTRHQPMLK